MRAVIDAKIVIPTEITRNQNALFQFFQDWADSLQAVSPILKELEKFFKKIIS